jgi:hypothetical protein
MIVRSQYLPVSGLQVEVTSCESIWIWPQVRPTGLQTWCFFYCFTLGL